jgi:superoxide dismutase, Cu-Zn family
MNCLAFFDSQSSSNSGKISGIVEFHSCGANRETFIRFKLKGFPAKAVRGIHVHEWGDLTQGCTSACAHFNPAKTLHGSKQLFDDSRHVGDLCNNITADEKGEVNFCYFDDLIELFGPRSIVGRMVVIHAGTDDLGAFRLQTDTTKGVESGKTGNAGARIACAVIGLTNRELHPSNEEVERANAYREWTDEVFGSAEILPSGQVVSANS